MICGGCRLSEAEYAYATRDATGSEPGSRLLCKVGRARVVPVWWYQYLYSQRLPKFEQPFEYRIEKDIPRSRAGQSDLYHIAGRRPYQSRPVVTPADTPECPNGNNK